MRWTDLETAKLAYLVDQFLKEGSHVSDACEKAAPLMQRSYNSCHSRYSYKIRYAEATYVAKYQEYLKESQNKNYSIFVNDKEVEIIVSDPSIIIAKDGDTTITVRIKS